MKYRTIVAEAPRGRDSAKPDEAMRVIERVSPAPRLETFARGSRNGWDTWGNESHCDVEMEVFA